MKVRHCSWALYDIQETQYAVSSWELLLLLTFYATFRRHFWNTFKCRAKLWKVPQLLPWRSMNTAQFSLKMKVLKCTPEGGCSCTTEAWNTQHPCVTCSSTTFLVDFKSVFSKLEVTHLIYHAYAYSRFTAKYWKSNFKFVFLVQFTNFTKLLIFRGGSSSVGSDLAWHGSPLLLVCSVCILTMYS